IWEKADYIVTFNANNGTSATTQQGFLAGETKSLAPNTFTKDGYVFTGWNTVPSGVGGEAYADQAQFTAKNATLYAQWAPAAFIVTFDANGGEGTMAQQGFLSGETKSLTANAFTKEGQKFVGWNTLAKPGDGQGEAYADQAQFTAKNATLYAQWADDDVIVVNFYPNGGEGNMAPQLIEKGDPDAQLNPNQFTKDGYTFTGWAMDANAQTLYADGAAVPSDQDINLYAVWTPIRYTITYNYNGAADVSNPAAYTVEDLALTLKNPVKDGATFLGWTGSNGTEPQLDVVIAPGTTGNLSFVANWSSDAYVVTFDANGGEGTMAQQGFLAGEPKALSANEFYRVGYKFLGWTPDPTNALNAADGTVPADLILDQQTIAPEGSVTLYAVWADDDFTVVTFNANGGEGFMFPQLFEKDHERALFPNAFTKEGYVFAGWSAVPFANNATIADQQTIKPAGDVTLYAVWKEAAYTVTFDANGGTGTMDKQYFAVDLPQALIPNAFTYSGYKFVGWTPDPTNALNATDTLPSDLILNRQTIAPDGSVTLYAVWQKNDITGKAVITEIPDQVYTGNEITPEISVIYNGDTTLKAGTDYTVEYLNNVNIGTATVVVSGTGDWSGITTRTFQIIPANLTNVSVEQAQPLTYNGNDQIPEVNVTASPVGNNAVTFTYSLDGQNYGPMPSFKEAGSYLVYFKASAPNHNDYVGTFVVTVDKGQAGVIDAPVARALTYNGTEQELVMGGTGSTLLVYSLDGTHYSYDIPKGTDAGLYTVWFKSEGSDNYNESMPGKVEVLIAQRDMMDVNIERVPDVEYNGSQFTPKPVVTYAGKILDEQKDFTYSWGENTNTPVGYVTVTAKDNSNFTGSKTAEFVIWRNTHELRVVIDQTQFAYDGTPKTPSVLAVYDGKTQLSKDQYAVYYINNVDAGTAGVYVIGQGNYQGEGYVEFTITKGTPELTVSKDDCYYGDPFTEPVISTNPAIKNPKVSFQYYKLPDYTLVPGVPTEIGTYKVVAILEGTDNYESVTAVTTFSILQKSITPVITLRDYDKVYDGTQKRPVVTVIDPTTSWALVEGQDYELRYENNIDAGTARVYIVANPNGNYKFVEASKDFIILPREVKLIWKEDVLPYTGMPQYPQVEVDPTSIAQREIDNHVDVRVSTVAAYLNGEQVIPVDVGTYACVATRLNTMDNNNNYVLPIAPAGTMIPHYYQIVRATMDDNNVAGDSVKITVNAPGDCVYNGQEWTPPITVLQGSDAGGYKTLVEGTDYTVTYVNNINAGTAKVRIDGIGDYIGTKWVDFTIDQRVADIGWYDMQRTDTNGKPVENASDTVVTEYNAQYQKPEAFVKNLVEGDACDVSVVTMYSDYVADGMIDAGQYRAKAVKLSNPNYKLPAAEDDCMINFNIDKAELFASIDDAYLAYTGQAQTPTVYKHFETRYMTTQPYDDFFNNLVSFRYGIVKGGEVGEPEQMYTDLPSFTDPGVYKIYFHATAPNHQDAVGLFHVIVGKILNPQTVTITLDPTEFTYTGEPCEPTVTVKLNDANGTLLVEGTDYTVSYLDNVNAGTATAVITGTGSNPQDYDHWYGVVTEPFTINKATNNVEVKPVDNLTYTGAPQELVTGEADFGEILYSDAEDGEYTADVPTGTDAGDYTVWYKVEGTDNYDGYGPASVTATIAKRDITPDPDPDPDPQPDGAIVTVEIDPAPTYTGSEVKPEPVVKITDKDGNTTVIDPETSVYTVDYAVDDDDFTNVTGKPITVTITGDDPNLTGVDPVTYTIAPKSINDNTVSVDAIPAQTATGKAIEPKPVVRDSETGNVLLEGTDYTIVGYSNNVSAGTATVTIKGINNYDDTRAVNFTIKSGGGGGGGG
ncbi:MAG: InlB B-repeat-containing protein, partial [Prevotella sp.]|nr:InlB B-repeat-containing protein [Prevotella sp.]